MEKKFDLHDVQLFQKVCIASLYLALNQPLRGGNLLYITHMKNYWMIQLTRPFYILESKGSQYNQRLHNNNIVGAQQ